MSNEVMATGILATVTYATALAGDAQVPPEAALGISAAMGVVGGTVSALIMTGDASINIRRVAVCAVTTAMVAPTIVFAGLDVIHEGSRSLIPVVTTSGIAGIIAWPLTDKAIKAFASVSPAKFGKWCLETLRKIIGGK